MRLEIKERILHDLKKQPIAEGKTKRIFASEGDPRRVMVVSKDDITGGDGAKRDIIPGKGLLANTTTCNVFRLLNNHNAPIAFEESFDEFFDPGEAPVPGFFARKCDMFPYEVVARRYATGSFIKRNPDMPDMTRFEEQPVVEFFLKTNGRKWKEHNLPCDDPLMTYSKPAHAIRLHDPREPGINGSPGKLFLVLSADEVFQYIAEWKYLEKMTTIALGSFTILEEAWRRQGHTLIDFKLEFGLDNGGRLVVADVIDNDSWRLRNDAEGVDVSKEGYRRGGDLDAVKMRYEQVAALTEDFRMMRFQAKP